MTGDGAVAHVAGACVGDGDFLHDDTVFITHGAEGCESRQVFKKVLRGGAVGVFQGKILVRPVAQKTDGYQISQGLLLDETSQFLAKPELEIYADDVKCSHGSTAGAVDETALFYLTSRGIPRRTAEELLVLAFVDEAIAEIEDARIADDDARAAGGLARAPADMRWPRGSSTRSGAAGATRAARWPGRSRAGLSEARALVHLMLACGLFFVASLPNALREARGARHRRAGRGRDRGASLRPPGAGAAARLRAGGGTCTSSPAASARAAGFLAARAALFWSLLLVGAAGDRAGARRRRRRGRGAGALAAARLARLCRPRLLALALRGEPGRGRGLRRHRPGGGGASPRASPRVAGAGRPRWPAAAEREDAADVGASWSSTA